ncbi:YncE family protein [Amycolatopsis thermoflava]|uniref:YncE family protein n=1 Tax=Amycolatopsis thermoflava TaxID=84480 RepID=UPI0038127112
MTRPVLLISRERPRARGEGLAAAPDHTFLSVADTGADTVTVIDIPTGTRHATVPVGAQPEGVAVSPR